MVSHLIPYEKVYLSVTMDLDEAQAVLDALTVVKADTKNRELLDEVNKLGQLLESGLERAAAYQARKGTT